MGVEGWGEGPARRAVCIRPAEADVTGVGTRAGLTALDDLIGGPGGLDDCDALAEAPMGIEGG